MIYLSVLNYLRTIIITNTVYLKINLLLLLKATNYHFVFILVNSNLPITVKKYLEKQQKQDFDKIWM